jgi:hypothetical protein
MPEIGRFFGILIKSFTTITTLRIFMLSTEKTKR